MAVDKVAEELQVVSATPSHTDIHTESDQDRDQGAGGAEAVLTTPEGRQIAIPHDTYVLFDRILRQLRLGRGVQLVVHDQELTTQQAADILNISRQYLVRLLDNEVIPSHRVGTHRRVALADVLEYRNTRSEERRESLARLTRASQEMGDY